MLGVKAFVLFVVAWALVRLSRRFGNIKFSGKLLSDSQAGRIFKNAMMGLVAVLALNFLSDLPMVKQDSDMAMDWLIRMNAGTGSTENPRLRPFVFIDIDEQTFRAWNEPLYTPREKLLQLIRTAVEAKAAVVVVDIELSRAMGVEDSTLSRYLESLAQQQNSQTTVLFARGLRTHVADSNYRQERSSFLDPLVEQSSMLRWGTTAFDVDFDDKIRRWRLSEQVCNSIDGKVTPKVLPSIHLETLTALDTNPLAARQRAQAALQNQLPASCDVRTSASNGDSIQLAGVRLTLDGGELKRRILYAFPWRLRDGEARQTFTWQGQADFPLLAVKPAYLFTESGAEIQKPSWQGQIVVIGASHAEGRDLHMTPLGEMPGSLILINAIHSLLAYGEAHTSPGWLALLVEIVAVLALSVLFASISFFWGMIITGSIVLFVLVPVSFWLFQDGLWLNFMMPVLVVQLLQLSDEFRDVRSQLPRNSRS